jgi:hypothetical protein
VQAHIDKAYRSGLTPPQWEARCLYSRHALPRRRILGERSSAPPSEGTASAKLRPVSYTTATTMIFLEVWLPYYNEGGKEEEEEEEEEERPTIPEVLLATIPEIPEQPQCEVAVCEPLDGVLLISALLVSFPRWVYIYTKPR